MKRQGRHRVEWVAVAMHVVWLLLALAGLAYFLAAVLEGRR